VFQYCQQAVSWQALCDIGLTHPSGETVAEQAAKIMRAVQCELVKDVLSPIPVSIEAELSTAVNNNHSIVSIAREMYETRDFTNILVLGNVLMSTSIAIPQAVDHCLSGTTHARGCWLVDSLLGQT